MRKILDTIKSLRQPHKLPSTFAAFLSLGTLTTLWFILRSPSESENAFFLGYSIEKTVLGAGLLLVLLSLLALTWKLVRQPEQSHHLWETVFDHPSVSTILFWISLIVFLICWIVLWMPPYRLARAAGYVVQLKPVIVWLAVVGAATMLTILFERGKESIGSVIQKNKTTVWAGVVILALFILAAGFVVLTGTGVRNPEDYWYASGVPVLGLQILFALTAGAFVMWLEPRWNARLSIRMDVIIFLALWIAAAWLWAREPIRPNFFMPDTADNPMYPYSDSATFDSASQFALIGQGLFNGQYFDRALYIAFLTYLHLFLGQNIEQILTVQAILFAVFPAILYLLGRELHSRAFGVAAGILILLRGLNSLVSATWMDLASPKMMLTDFVATIGISLFMLLFIKWMKSPVKNHLAVWAGGMLGLTIMVRTNVLFLLPAFLVYAWIVLRPRWKTLTIGSLLLIFGMLTATTPWDLRNLQNGTPMFYVYYYRIQEVLRARYGIQEDTYQPPTYFTAVQGVSRIGNPTYKFLVRPGNWGTARQRHLQAEYCDTQPCKIVNHFSHNFITSVLFLPSSFALHDLWNTLKLDAPYWSNDWVGGDLSFGEGMFIFLNLTLISLGFGALWERNKVISLVPVIVFLAYIFTNALGFTSGGRYIVPVDWIICVYYMAGLLQIADWVLRFAGVIPAFEVLPIEVASESPVRYPVIVSAFVLVFVIGSLIPLSEMPFERRYPDSSRSETLTMLEERGLFENTSFDRRDLAVFLTDPQAQMLVGRMLYPRYYHSGDGEPDRHYPYVKLDYQRLVFTIIGPFGNGKQFVIIPGYNPKRLLHTADVVVVGCKAEKNLDGLVVFVLSEPEFVYLRNPESELKCPLQSPTAQP